MESGLGIQLILSITGVAPAIFFHLRDTGFLMSTVLSAMTSSWTLALLLVFYSGMPWGLALVGGISWMPAFALVAASVGVTVRIARKATDLRKEARSREGEGRVEGNVGDKKEDEAS